MKTCTKCGETKKLDQFQYRKDSKKHRPHCKACRAVEKSEWQKGTPELTRNRCLKYKYGITSADYERMLFEQNNCCYICHAECKLVVDHCHESGKVRGLLCNYCNVMLGMAKDNPALLRLAANYLELAKQNKQGAIPCIAIACPGTKRVLLNRLIKTMHYYLNGHVYNYATKTE